MIKLLRRQKAVAFGFLVHDLRLVLAWTFNRWLLTGVVTAWAIVAAGLAVTRCATAWTAALGWRGASGCAAASARSVLTATRASARCCTGALSRRWRARTTATTLVVFVLVRADVVSAVAKVVHVVITELVRRAIGV